MSGRPEVLVVGAGPVGLALGLALARTGRRVLVLEKRAGPSEHSRAPAIWPRTQEILDELGVLDRCAAEGILLDRLEPRRARDGRPLLSLDLRELSGRTRFPRLLVLPQSRTERLLLEALSRQPTAEVRFSTEVLGVEEEGALVRARVRGADTKGAEGGEELPSAPFLVGCDGAHGVVREAIGARLEGITYPLRAALADVRVEGADGLPFPRISTADGVAVALRIGPGLWRLILPFGEDEEPDLEGRVARAVARIFTRPNRETVWQSEFRLHRRIASAFARGRVAIAGDAAHLNSPVGGQGMNAGIQDAAALAPRLEEALARDDPAPLAAYGSARRAAIGTGVNRFTDRLTRLVLVRRGRLIEPSLRCAGLLLRLGPLRRRVLARLAMIDGPGRDAAPIC